MGKASKWFRSFLGSKRSSNPQLHTDSESKPSKEKRRWSFVKSYREKDTRRTGGSYNGASVTLSSSDYVDGVDPNKHAIAVAAATAAVAEAAVAAAHAAAAVVRLTSSGRCNATTAYVSASCSGVREDWAAVKIQSAFRGYLVSDF